ncbi:hypothetical protein [Streptomyces sp. NPDC001389]|uniref:hypothetical protein n=1 Tax=unclassified Streptomyces TaxID=2593676 RepID=UPI0036A0121F
MPGQRKRKAQRRREADAWNRRPAGAQWERRFSTQDRDELRAYLDGLSRSGVRADEIRIDMPCGRLEHPTWYTVSVLVPTPDRPS